MAHRIDIENPFRRTVGATRALLVGFVKELGG